MSACSVFGCPNNHGSKKKGLTYHRFPVNPSRRVAWIKALGMEGWVPTDHSRVCSDHFSKDQFKTGCHIRLRLKEDALPNASGLTFTIEKEVIQKPDSNLNQESRRLKALNEEKFMENFNPDTSIRETRKVNRKIYNQFTGSNSLVLFHSSSKKSSALYNHKGIHVSTGRDLCDCLDAQCPGCHFPCPKCYSEKCGHECRVNRKWTYESYTVDGYTIDGVPEPIKNPLIGK